MGVSSSLYASISGLSTMGNAMSVLGDNVSNVNTIAFKSSRATFQDVLTQSVATAAGTAQVGRGVTMTTIDGVFAQGSFESTSTATDLAIGGQGFFMLRASGSAEADMYTRAGEFRFDKEGYLVNPTGNFVQGWTLDSASGERQGTIGDINLGKTTPPVQTTSAQIIANLDSRKNNETTNLTLFDAWDGTNAALTVATAPISSTSYEYTTAIKVYDSVGASHDLTVYFDRTTTDNQWEFLVTCVPSEDKRVLSTGRDATNTLDGSNDEASIYTPDTSYNYQTHKGAGALLYGKIDFSTSGSISNISAWHVPPDGMVDPEQRTNRLVLSSSEQYYSFEANFTGAPINQQIALNLGAKYSGQSTPVSQILVSGGAAYATVGTSSPITKETLWNSVYDSNGTGVDVTTPAIVSFSGYNKAGLEVSGSYTLVAGGKVKDLLTKLDNTFACTASIDASGKLKMTDANGGASGLSVTNFFFSSGVNPFGDGTSIAKAIALSGSPLVAADGTTPITSAATLLTSVYESGNGSDKVDNGDVFTFGGTKVDGSPASLAFTVGSSGTTVQSLLTALENAYSVNPGDVTASLDSSGYIRLVDLTASGIWAPSLVSTTQHTAAEPFGVAGVKTSPFTSEAMTVISTGAAAIGTSSLTNVLVGGNAIALGDVISFVVNTDAGGNVLAPVVRNFTVGTTGTTVTDLMDWMDDVFTDGAVGGGSGGTTTALVGGVITVSDAGDDLSVTLSYTPHPAASTPLGAGGAFTLSDASTGVQVNVTTSKQQIVSTGRAVTTSGGSTPINNNTALSSVYDGAGVALAGTSPTFDSLTFVGVRGNNTPLTATFTAGTSFGLPLTGANSPPTMQDLLSWLEEQFDAEASIDGAGRLILTDRQADEIATTGYHSSLAITSISAGSSSTARPFGGTVPFSTIAADTSGGDGSRMGGAESINFSTEALSTTQYANSSTTIFQDQDGFAAGFLQSVSVDTSGVITGNYSNGQVLERAQVALASFNNLAGLSKEGGNIFRGTTASGAPITGPPGTNGLGTISPNSLEQSNVDLGAEFVKLITTQRGFQANSKIITTTDEMLQDLINLKR